MKFDVAHLGIRVVANPSMSGAPSKTRPHGIEGIVLLIECPSDWIKRIKKYINGGMTIELACAPEIDAYASVKVRWDNNECNWYDQGRLAYRNSKCPRCNYIWFDHSLAITEDHTPTEKLIPRITRHSLEEIVFDTGGFDFSDIDAPEVKASNEPYKYPRIKKMREGYHDPRKQKLRQQKMRDERGSYSKSTSQYEHYTKMYGGSNGEIVSNAHIKQSSNSVKRKRLSDEYYRTVGTKWHTNREPEIHYEDVPDIPIKPIKLKKDNSMSIYDLRKVSTTAIPKPMSRIQGKMVEEITSRIDAEELIRKKKQRGEDLNNFLATKSRRN